MEITTLQYANASTSFERILKKTSLYYWDTDIIVDAIKNQSPTVPLRLAGFLLLCSFASTRIAVLELHQRRFLIDCIRNAASQGRVKDDYADYIIRQIIRPDGFEKQFLLAVCSTAAS